MQLINFIQPTRIKLFLLHRFISPLLSSKGRDEHISLSRFSPVCILSLQTLSFVLRSALRERFRRMLKKKLWTCSWELFETSSDALARSVRGVSKVFIDHQTFRFFYWILRLNYRSFNELIEIARFLHAVINSRKLLAKCLNLNIFLANFLLQFPGQSIETRTDRERMRRLEWQTRSSKAWFQRNELRMINIHAKIAKMKSSTIFARLKLTIIIITEAHHEVLELSPKTVNGDSFGENFCVIPINALINLLNRSEYQLIKSLKGTIPMVFTIPLCKSCVFVSSCVILKTTREASHLNWIKFDLKNARKFVDFVFNLKL